MIPYEVIEHTADIGLKIRGENLEALFRNASLGLFSLITNIDTIKQSENKVSLEFQLEAENAGELLLKWMREILFFFSAKRYIPCEINFENIQQKKLSVKIKTGNFDPNKHEQRYEVKAVTYHGFKIEENPDGWMAEVILDI